MPVIVKKKSFLEKKKNQHNSRNITGWKNSLCVAESKLQQHVSIPNPGITLQVCRQVCPCLQSQISRKPMSTNIWFGLCPKGIPCWIFQREQEDAWGSLFAFRLAPQNLVANVWPQRRLSMQALVGVDGLDDPVADLDLIFLLADLLDCIARSLQQTDDVRVGCGNSAGQNCAFHAILDGCCPLASNAVYR